MNKFDITVVMAIYKPNLEWLKEELISIQKQTYRNFQVFAWNDCPDDKTDYNLLFKQYLLDIPFKIFNGTENLGSNGAFENLTRKVDTPYIAYCDQDDIWMPDKLEKLYSLFDTPDITLAYSDMKVINEKSEVVAQCIHEVRPRQVFYEREEALPHLLAKNFVTGCTMMVRNDIAQQAVPFPKTVFHDWWLAVCAAIKGNIVIASKPLMKYRIYSGNQSAVLKGVADKKSYYMIRIKQHKNFIDYAYKIFPNNNNVVLARRWNHAREKYFFYHHFSDLIKIFSMREYNRSIVLLEILLPFIPEGVFRKIIALVRNGKI